MKAIIRKMLKAVTPYGVVVLRRRIQEKQLQKQIELDAQERHYLDLKMWKTTPQRELFFEIHITEHCNLNCAGCSHFSPIAKERYLDPMVFDRDLARLAEITDKKLAYIKLLGGEPLLHPECDKLMRIARTHFDKTTTIILLTNGVLLAQQSESFWESAAANKVWIAITHYPIKLPIERIKELAVKYGVTVGYFTGAKGVIDLDESPDGGKTMYRLPLDLHGSQNCEESFVRCIKSNTCFTLRDGKLYNCSTLPHIFLFNEYFNVKLEVSPDDSIDIYKASSLDEILSFLAKPVPFCRFCNTKGITHGHIWEQTKKDICEWI